ncbi:MAG TPA: class I SAM-dependent methyltransferase, partial [Candidatus Ozemobacteraceae bacterium]|nr:class I SAM-dependent methyltransferase [Candidatus Ozemobacteraceae bacterium]
MWEEIFRARAWGKYPPEELIRFTARAFYRAPDRSSVKILDAGCGPGACCWYLAREGFTVTGVDGSLCALQQARERLAQERLTGTWVRGDLLHLPFPEASFDGVIDIAAVQQNRPAAIRSIIAGVSRILKPGGRFFSMMLAHGSWGDDLGRQIVTQMFISPRVL